MKQMIIYMHMHDQTKVIFYEGDILKPTFIDNMFT
jgi:hypothetical protein